MKTVSSSAGFLAIILTLRLAVAADDAEALRNWPQWRGPLANGVAPEADPPLEWSETKNVKWKVKIPGEGSSTPAIWGDRVFVLAAVGPEKKADAKSTEAEARPAGPPPGPGSNDRPPGPGGGRRPGGPGGGFGRAEKPTEKYQFTVLCLDRKTGKTLWQKVAREEVPHAGHQQNNTFASASPITDGNVLLAYFGSAGLHCYDLDGNLKWEKDFGRMQTKMGFGEGASPTLHGDTVIVNWDDETENDFILALDKNDGKQLWKTPRNESTGWSTPLVVEHGKKFQVVVNATGKVRSYDFESGKELWSCGGQTANAIPSPVADADTVYVTSGFRGSALQAIKLGSTGELTGTETIRWSYNQNTPYVPSPLLAGDLLYAVKVNSGILTCLDAKSGKPHFEAERLEGISEIYASPVAAKQRVYVLGRDGKCVVLKQGPKLEILATNKLDDQTDASIAIAGKELFIRGRDYLYCIAAP
jgi:outer membrane protein assembly factor BamB